MERIAPGPAQVPCPQDHTISRFAAAINPGNEALGRLVTVENTETRLGDRFMFEKLRIKEHMEVADNSGQHVGTVDEVVDDRIKLTKTDSADGSHHFIAIDQVDRIDDNRIYLKAGTPIPMGLGNT
jgi:hypothetical protein